MASSFTRATTPTHIFTLPLAIDTIRRCRVTYSQCGVNVLTRDVGIEVDDSSGMIDLSKAGDNETMLTVKLSQTDTVKFADGRDVEIQVRVFTASGDALASEIICVSVNKILDDEVIE